MTMNRTILSAAIGALLASCAGIGLASAQEITVWTLNFSNKQANEAMDKIATDFEAANPGATVTDRHVAAPTTTRRRCASLQVRTRVPTSISAGPASAWAASMSKRASALPLDKYYTEYKWSDRLVPSAASFADLYPGGKHGVPYTFKGEAVYYNKKLPSRRPASPKSRRPMTSCWPRPRS